MMTGPSLHIRPLTSRQKQVLQYIVDYHSKHGIPPTYREIRDEVGIDSISTAYYHVQALARAGCVEMSPTISRGIRILSKTTTEPPADVASYVEDVLRGSRQLPRAVMVDRVDNEIVLSWPNNGPRHTVRIEPAA